MTGRAIPTLDRLAVYFEIDDNGCWIWISTKTRRENGYGQIRIKGKNRAAHRVAWEEVVGPIPDGLQLDHLCRTRLCINPDHLEPVTPAENTRRGDLPSLMRDPQWRPARPARADECKWGHKRTPENTLPSGSCRPCVNEHRRAKRRGITRDELRSMEAAA